MSVVIKDETIIRVLYTKAEIDALLLQPLVDSGDLPELPVDVHLNPVAGDSTDYTLFVAIDNLAA